eukprot:TRINITY_DN8696_c0_g1_i4.p1 TRINITY_DN8696_c0_g1~~TRINITY_DN8696_c0_g1_i4.p1  ORF type:complete len:111 (+),score=10.29 TRINITY_DN8696_c0_g1_i4:151-483(+)
MDTTVDPAPTASRHFRSSKRTAGQPSNSASSSPSTKRSHGGGSRATVSEGEPTSAVKTGLNFDAMAAKHGLAPTSSKWQVGNYFTRNEMQIILNLINNLVLFAWNNSKTL